MMICPKCLNVYATMFTQYCPNDGKKCVDSGSKEAEPLIIRLKYKLKVTN